jgi:hypothetical protein
MTRPRRSNNLSLRDAHRGYQKGWLGPAVGPRPLNLESNMIEILSSFAARLSVILDQYPIIDLRS